VIRVAILDDEPLARSGLRARLAAQADLEVVAEFADGQAALDGLRAQAVDLAFVDVRMPGLSGLDVLAALPQARRPLAILLTAHDGFAVRAFALRAIDYLLKPIDDVRLAESLDRAREMHRWRRSPARPEAPAQPPARRFEVRIGQRLRFVDAEAVEWIEAEGDYARLHSAGQSHLIRESLSRLMTQLDPARFMRVHRSAIVRSDCVADLQPLPNRDAMLRLRDGTPVRASRSYMDPLMQRLAGLDVEASTENAGTAGA
jgi:two-component system LytT family response regulator